MSHIKIQFEDIGLGSASKVEVDGMNLAGVVHDVTMQLTAGCLGRVSLDILVTSCEITAEGAVEINSTPVNNDIGYAIYKQLQEHFANLLEE